ncbi:protein giant-like [Ornithodoros turicata]|uniref:protein giant-like n=1 Tax=Ornithodoros turicata TaxID=34597 RepID=UPI003138BC63
MASTRAPGFARGTLHRLGRQQAILKRAAMDTNVRITPPYVPNDRHSPWRDSQADEPQPLDFSRKTSTEPQDSVQLTPSPTPPEPQAFLHPFSDVMMAFGTATTSPGAKNGDDVNLQQSNVEASLPSLRQPAFPSTPNKYTRPFKAYPRDPLSVPLGYYGLQLPLTAEALAAQSIITSASDQAYLQFRQQMMISRADHRRVRASPENASQLICSPPNQRDSEGEHTSSDNSNGDVQPIRPADSKKRGRLPEDLKDEAYWERRRKNNEAAKRSRDARRAKEDEIAIRAAFLEQENLKLRVEVAGLKNEMSKLRCLLYQ